MRIKSFESSMVYALLALAGCSSSTSAAPDSQQPAADAGTTPPPPASTSKMNVWVYRDAPMGETPAPLAGAQIELDPSGGGARVEATTDASGHAVLDVDFTKGPGTVTAFAAGHVMATFFGVDTHASETFHMPQLGKPAEDFVLYLAPDVATATAATVQLSGSILNATSASDRVNLGPSGPGTIFDQVATKYSMRVPKGKPYFLLGSEYSFTNPDPRSASATIAKFFKIDRPATDADATFDVDIAGATAVPTVTNHIRLELPGGDAGPFGGSGLGSVNVSDADQILVPGVIQKAAPSADKNGFDCEVAVAQVETASPLTTVGVLRTTDGAQSTRIELGVLPDGSTMSGFLAPPTLPSAEIAKGAAIPLQGLPKETNVARVQLFDAKGVPLWFLFTPAGPTELALPAPPPGATVPSSLQGVLVAASGVTQVPNGPALAKALSFSKPFKLAR